MAIGDHWKPPPQVCRLAFASCVEEGESEGHPAGFRWWQNIVEICHHLMPADWPSLSPLSKKKAEARLYMHGGSATVSLQAGLRILKTHPAGSRGPTMSVQAGLHSLDKGESEAQPAGSPLEFSVIPTCKPSAMFG